MPSLQLVACRAFPYAGGSVASGQRFEAKSTHDAFILKRIGHAIDAPRDGWDCPSGPDGEPGPDGFENKTTDDSPVVKPKRSYRRRRVETPTDAD